MKHRFNANRLRLGWSLLVITVYILLAIVGGCVEEWQSVISDLMQGWLMLNCCVAAVGYLIFSKDVWPKKVAISVWSLVGVGLCVLGLLDYISLSWVLIYFLVTPIGGLLIRIFWPVIKEWSERE